MTNMSDARETICSICRLLYANKWAVGTGGGVSIREGDVAYISPSGVEKELISADQIVAYRIKDEAYESGSGGLKPSACTPLFLEFFKNSEVSCVIHTHSTSAVLCSMMYDKEFTMTDIEQIKALPKGDGKNLQNIDTLCIPIIENAPEEEDLMPAIKWTLARYPHACAVLVRKHGLFVWGPSAKKAKVYIESIDYLFEVAIRMRQLGLS